jgi:hypothetical protein
MRRSWESGKSNLPPPPHWRSSPSSSMRPASTLRTSTVIKNAGPKKIFPLSPQIAVILTKLSAFRRERIPEQLRRT